jgi:hypothetical protein
MDIRVECANCKDTFTVNILNITRVSIEFSTKHLNIFDDKLFCTDYCLADYKGISYEEMENISCQTLK